MRDLHTEAPREYPVTDIELSREGLLYSLEAAVNRIEQLETELAEQRTTTTQRKVFDLCQKQQDLIIDMGKLLTPCRLALTEFNQLRDRIVELQRFQIKAEAALDALSNAIPPYERGEGAGVTAGSEGASTRSTVGEADASRGGTPSTPTTTPET